MIVMAELVGASDAFVRGMVVALGEHNRVWFMKNPDAKGPRDAGVRYVDEARGPSVHLRVAACAEHGGRCLARGRAHRKRDLGSEGVATLMAKKSDNTWVWILLFLGIGLAASGTAKADSSDPFGGGGDDGDDDDGGTTFKSITFLPGGAAPTPGKPGVKTPDVPVWIPPIDQPDPVDPGGPTPADVWNIIKEYPTPGTFYQIVGGDTMTGESKGIATRLGRTALFMAAKQIGGLSDSDANEWAKARLGYQNLKKPVTEWIACAPFNDMCYGTYAFSDKTIPGMQGRGIRMLPNAPNNALRIASGEPPLRNIRLCAPGDPPSCSRNPINGAYRKQYLLWLPEFDLQKLWDSGGLLWEPGGTWGDGSSKILPPPKIWALGLIDLSDAGLGSWGCAPFHADAPETIEA